MSHVVEEKLFQLSIRRWVFVPAFSTGFYLVMLYFWKLYFFFKRHNSPLIGTCSLQGVCLPGTGLRAPSRKQPNIHQMVNADASSPCCSVICEQEPISGAQSTGRTVPFLQPRSGLHVSFPLCQVQSVHPFH